MMAHHPLTGKPIRVMRTETHLCRDKKTLVWLRGQELSASYNRWETIISNLSDLSRWQKTIGAPLLFVSDTRDVDEVREILDSGVVNGVHLMFFRRDVLKAYGKDKLKQNGFQNIICIEEIQTMYPHTHFKYSDKASLEEIVLAIALLFRLKHVAGFTEGELANLQPYMDRISTIAPTTISLDKKPEELWLIQQYFVPSKAKREKEIRTCLEKNIQCQFIDKIVLLNEDVLTKKMPKSSKIQEVVIGHRLTYWDVMEYIQKHVPANVFVVFSNSDIFLDESWQLLWSTNLEDKFLSILRYEHDGKLFGPRPDSQDTWVVTSTSLKKRKLVQGDFDFEFGKPGCDNAVNISMLKNKFVVCNPALNLKTHHMHESGIRTYDPLDCLEKPMYLYIEPTGLHDMMPQTDLSEYEVEWTASQPFTRKVHGDRKELRTLCTMLTREGFNVDPDEENRWFPSNKEKEVVYKMSNASQTYNGLVFDATKIFLGKYNNLRELWSQFELSQLTPALKIKSSVAVICTDQDASNPYMYVHNYISKVLRMRDAGYKGEFWVPKEESKLYENVLREFGWDEDTIPIMPRNKDIQAYSETLYMLAPSFTSGATFEEVTSLRQHLKAYKPTPTDKSAVILQDDEFYDIQDSAALEKVLQDYGYETTVIYPQRTSFDRVIGAMCGAALCVSSLTKKTLNHTLYWLLPVGAKVIEGGGELEAMGAGLHEAGAAGLEYWYFSMPRGKKSLLREVLVEKVSKIMDKMQGGKEEAKPSLPSLVLPIKKDGFHGHVGDSFRELAEMWGERGYVDIDVTSTGDFCWLRGLGEVLLYDRPTYEWFEKSEESKSFQMALVGNPLPLDEKPMRNWTFWGRKPRLIEEIVSEGIQRKGYADRAKSCVFYGKVENTVQEENRKKWDWSLACDEFVMLKDQETYPYTHEEYLRKLTESKYGLCLAGFGIKCNREIECMAMGCVPICSPEVDMDSYAEKPVEGLHYFRVANPTEAKVIAETTTQEEWKKMSDACRAWWLANASCEGSWLLTKRLCGM